MERKLVSIQKINSIDSIEGADNILQAGVMGWTVVVKKGEFQVGDLCVFFEVDSVLPDGEPWAEFMRSKKFRVKTIKLRGVLSQGLALPMEILPSESGSFNEGDEVTDLLRVTKYEPPVHDGGAKMGAAIGGFPARVPKTDEIRVQSALGVLEEIKDLPFYYTQKYDGTSSTFVFDDELMVCSRRFRKREDDTNIYWQMANKYDLGDKLKSNPLMAVQGEICGPGIQKNKIMLKELDLFVFNVYDIMNGKYLNFEEFMLFCKTLGLKTVPIESIVKDPSGFDHSLEAWLERAKGKYANTKNHREGLVIRPLEETYSKTLKGRLSFKVINNDFLLKEK